MPFVQAKCSNCDGILSVDDSLEAAVCPFCNTPYIVEKAINNYSVSNAFNVGSGAIINVIGNQNSDFKITAGKLWDYVGAATDVVIPDTVKEISCAVFVSMLTNEGKKITSVVIPESVKRIEKETFLNCTELKTVNLPNGLEYIGEGAFSGCKKLKEIRIPSKVTEIGPKAFYKCKELNTVILQEGIHKIEDEAFYQCESLKEIDIPSSIDQIGYQTFSGCKSLAKISLSNGISKIEYGAFENCSSLKEIKLPNSLKTMEDAAFRFCTALETVELGNGIEILDREVFFGCCSLKKIIIPSGIKYLMGGAFANCTSLNEVTLSEGLKIIGAIRMPESDWRLQSYESGIRSLDPEDKQPGVFQNIAIKEITIPSSVENIGTGAFADCTSLENITIINKNVEIGSCAFRGCKVKPDVSRQQENNKVNNQGKDGCYIATSVYGSYDCPQVWTLRRYRDYSLYSSFVGRIFIKCYYATSPTLVKYFGDNRLFKRFWQKCLDIFVSNLRHKGYENTPYSDRDY